MNKIKRFILLCFTSLLVVSCGNPMGNRVDSKNLNVYYIDCITKDKAISFTKFWRDRGFVGEDFQTIQLACDEANRPVVKLIEKESFNGIPLDYKESAAFGELVDSLKAHVFGLDSELRILITDNTFRPLQDKK